MWRVLRGPTAFTANFITTSFAVTLVFCFFLLPHALSEGSRTEGLEEIDEEDYVSSGPTSNETFDRPKGAEFECPPRKQRESKDDDDDDDDDDDVEEERESLQNVSCSERKHMLDMRVESVKRDLLQKLNMASPPNITTRYYPAIPRLDEIMKNFDKNCNNDNEPASNIILVGKSSDDNLANDGECSFSAKNNLAAKRLESATLGLFVRRPWRYNASSSGWILIYFNDRVVLKKKLSMSANETNTWYQFNITQKFNDWLFGRTIDFNMTVVGSDSRGNPLVVVKPYNERENELRPYILLKLKDQMSSRLKRKVDDDCEEGVDVNRCCRYPLHLNFSEIGWNWVIVPVVYNAYYCAGSCPTLYRDPNMYSFIRDAQLNIDEEDMNRAKCCTGKTFSPISILYFDSDRNIVYSKVPNMIIESCSCI